MIETPKGCLTKSCFSCDWHVVVGEKLDCNYQNRLGLGKPTVEAFGGENEEEVAERALKVAEERAKKAKETLKKLKKTKEEIGEQKGLDTE